MQLGWELKLLREKSGFTLEGAVDGLTFSASKLDRVESALTTLPKVSDLKDLLGRYGVTDEEDVEYLAEIHRESLNRGWWRQPRLTMPSGTSIFAGLERRARSVRVWQPSVVYGLLQTERYARELMQGAKPVLQTTAELVQGTTELRMQWKRALTRDDGPLEMTVVMCEAALRRVVGSKELMLEQYDEIIRLAKLDNVTVQILPMAIATYRSSSNFSLIDYGKPLPSIVQVDEAGGAGMSDGYGHLRLFNRVFDALRAGALPPGETKGFLQRLAQELKAP
ncbi:helix-turn-helix domain-containing protein [Streptomyces gamaensis]|uniref:Helix-turn-helix domain-containing protein n=1 Tax=Streptomyces gamaensis TaxID=1763542 RepID=A0ABW0Z2Z1_9ACTN